MQVFHVCFHLLGGTGLAIWIATSVGGHTRQATTSALYWPTFYLWHIPLAQMDVANAGGFQTVALVGFISPLAVTVLGPATGQLLDHSPRQLALNTCAVVQGICIVISGKTYHLNILS